MSEKTRALRALVSERLNAAAEEIFALVETTIAEYEEELRRSREENQRNQRLLEENQRNQRLLEENQRNQRLLEEKQKNQRLLEENQRNQRLLEENQRNQRRLEEKQRNQWLLEEKQRNQLLLDAILRPRVQLHRLPDFLVTKTVSCGELVVNTEPEEPEPNPEPAQNLYPHMIVKKHSPDTASRREPPIKDENEPVLLQEQPIIDENVLEPTCYRNEEAPEDWTQQWEAPVESKDAQGKQDGKDGKDVDLNQPPTSDTAPATTSSLKTCPICNKTLKSDLWSHVLLHTEERPFSCSVCKKGFTRKSSLSLHMRLHLKVKPFRCSVCGKRFAQNSHLKLHKHKK